MKITTEIIDRYLKNQCSAEEAEYLENYIQQSGNSLDKLLPQQEWDVISVNLDYHNQEEISQKVFAHIKQKRTVALRRKIFNTVFKVAALLILVLGFFVLLNPFKKETLPQHSESTTLSATKDDISNLYYINSGNESIVLTASDGSVITLYPKSEIKYAEDFSNLHERTLYLKGKAKFEVAKNKDKPFRVHSTGVITTALGTVFIVDELRPTQTQIELLEGRIEVKAEDLTGDKKLIRSFMPNEKMTLDHKDLKILEEVKISTQGSERRGYFFQNSETIQFKNIALEEVLSLLAQNYAIHLQYDKSKIKNKFYSGTYSIKEQVYIDIIQEINYLHHTNINYTNSDN